MKKILLALSALILVLSCTSGGAPPAAETTVPPAPSIADSEVGLAPGTAFEQPPQVPIAFNRVDPGESELRPVPNAEFPPVIPHSIADLETITLDENACLDCHDPAVAVDMGAVVMPKTHFVDLRRSPGKKGSEVVGSRWVCTGCHVAQTDTEPLVANSSSG
jgi:nitrate reductase cytochrome c-type subunit